jgi:hypothetical protein
MSKSTDWRSYITPQGDFELPNYLFEINKDLMKQALDLGTLLSDDRAKLRAFKEQTKNVFKKRWLEVAQALEAFDIITPCGCEQNEYCRVCGGSRYRLNSALSPDEMREVAVVIGAGQKADLTDKLQKGLMRALQESELYFDMSAMQD